MINKEEIYKRLSEEGPQNWYHNFEIIKGSGIFCDPKNPPRLNNSEHIFESLGIKEDFWRGLRVLDIGSYNGARSFYLEDCGAKVTALDIQPPESNGFKLIHELRKSSVEFVLSSVYDLTPLRFKHFDAILFFGVFYHLKHPLLALERINSVCKTDGLLIGGGTTSDKWFHDDDLSCEKGVDFDRITNDIISDKKIMNVKNLNELSLCGFSGSQYYKDDTNWFIPNITCLKEWLRVSGFRIKEFKKRVSKIPREWNKSGIMRSIILFKANRMNEPIPEYKDDSYEVFSRVNQKLYLKKYQIPTSYEIKLLLEENKRLKNKIKMLKTQSKAHTHDED